jgi:hypothetical protein
LAYWFSAALLREDFLFGPGYRLSPFAQLQKLLQHDDSLETGAENTFSRHWIY